MPNLKLYIRKLKDYPGHKRDWKRGKEDVVYENANYAKIQAVMITEEDGTKCYDTIIFIEPSVNAIIVPINESKDRIYLQKQYRPVVMKKWYKIKTPNLKAQLAKHGRLSIEIPRGCFERKEDKEPLDTARREMAEEMKIKKPLRKDVKFIGRINPNTSYYTSSYPVYMAKVNTKQAVVKQKKEKGEKIKKGKWYSIKEVKGMIKKNKIICAVTLAAINLALQHLKQ